MTTLVEQVNLINKIIAKCYYTPRNEVIIPPATKLGGVYWNHPVRPSVRLSVRPSVCRRAVR